MDNDPYVPFSQRTGLEPIPPQLKLGEVSQELRRLVDYYVSQEIDRNSYAPYSSAVFNDRWLRVAQDLHVLFFRKAAEDFDHGAYENQKRIRAFVARSNIGQLFDFVEFIVRHPGCSEELKNDLARSFTTARAAYRIVDCKHIVAIGVQEQAEAYLRALDAAQSQNALGARKHLIDSGIALREGRWTECVREAIHAVESVAVKLAPGTSTLGKALTPIEKRGLLNGRLKAALEKLYAYANDENGVRHALVFEEAESRVDEIDALFMLGACASFVSYLLSRSIQLDPDAK
jgi:hypothetical protein